MQNKIILFCYAYIVGLVIAKLAPVEARFLPAFWVLTGIGLAVSAAWALVRWLRTSDESEERSSRVRIAWAGLVTLTFIVMGYTRYISADTVPDQRTGLVRITDGQAAYQQEIALPDASRLRLVKREDLGEDIQLRIHGELDARLPVLDENGLPTMDARARWRFNLARVPQESEIVTIQASDPVGTDYLVSQPFSRITRIELVAPKNTAQTMRGGVVALYRVSNHIGSFARVSRQSAPVTILGRITQDPFVYGFQTRLTVTPAYVQTASGGTFFKVEGGDILVTIKPDLVGYEAFARTEAYGSDMVVQGSLTLARTASNPGGFNDRRFRQNYNMYGMMSVMQDRDSKAAPLNKVGPAGGPPRHGNRLVEFSLGLRDRMLRVMKLTIPFPQSAFLGGVTLGLRYGLQSTQCLFGGQHGPLEPEESNGTGAVAPAEGCEEYIADEFKMAGVNHVLAVSGLHVTIITAMLVGLCAMLRLHKQVFVPLIIMALIIFAIITGARPSVLRAVIMHALFLLTWAYMAGNIRSSALLGVPVAAFLILLQNPLVLVDPSFTLSFGAILSLVLITTPAFDLFSHLRGNTFLAAGLLVLFFTGVGILKWPLLVTPQFLLPAGLVAFGVMMGAARLEKRGIRLIGGFGYTDIPPGVAKFMAAQVAIQVGMMLPLSLYYFCRWPFAGAYANFIALPLIGIVVQLGAMAGLLGLIPGVGLYIALMLSAANWLFSTAFLWLAHISALIFPYPAIRRPTERFLVVYYLLCGIWIWNKPLRQWLTAWSERRGWSGRKASSIGMACLVLLVTTPLWFGARPKRAPGLEVTVLSVQYGSSILVQTPGGKNILVDAGMVEHDRGRRNESERTILNFLSHKWVRQLDALVITSPRPERGAGAAYILRNAWVKNLYLPAGLVGVEKSWTADDIMTRLAGSGSDQYGPGLAETLRDEYAGNPAHPRRVSLAGILETRRDTIWNRWAGTVVHVAPLKAGEVLAEETIDGKTFRLEVLHPGDAQWTEFPMENNSAVLRLSYGDFAMLITSDLHFAGQRELAESVAPDKLRAQVLVVPDHGIAQPRTSPNLMKGATEAALASDLGALLDKVAPEKAIFEFGNPRPALGTANRDALQTFELTWRFVESRVGARNCYNTDQDSALFIHSDGQGYTLSTQAEANRAEGGGEESVDEIDMAF
ncbi:MAG: ComEC/Rec2 family competence protein [Verrucomicrobia bacterium]|nr:ComEC/Rec2 family competence protein [Verrucomicrobiota bacterium]